MSFSDFFASLLGRQTSEGKPGQKPVARPPSGAEAAAGRRKGAPPRRPGMPGAAGGDPPPPGGPITVAPAAESQSDLLGDLTDEILEALGPGGAMPVQDHAAPAAADTSSMSEVQDLFASIASNYFRPVQNFVFELKKGSAPTEWIDICEPVLGSIIDGARSLDFPEVAERMLGFQVSLQTARESSGSRVEAEQKDQILARYQELIDVLPGSFNPGEDDHRRESIIIHSLLRQIPDVGKVSLERIYAAGLTSLDALFGANKNDLAETTGVALWLCSRICDRIGAYRREQGAPQEVARNHRKRLTALADELTGVQAEFRQIAESSITTPEETATKRDCMRRRQSCLLRIDMLLAEMGEVDLVDSMKRLAAERRIETLRKHISSLQASGPGPALQHKSDRPEQGTVAG